MISVAVKIKLTILLNAIKNGVLELRAGVVISTETADELFEVNKVYLQDEIEKFRQSGIETGVYRSGALYRGYEDTDEMAGQLYDGTWAGWTGGGKHGDPCDIPWIEQAYSLDLVKEEVVQVIRLD